jgi:hypothetical protein
VSGECQSVVAHGQTDSGGASIAADHVFSPEEYVDATVMDDCSRVEDILRAPGHVDAGNGTGEAEVWQLGQDVLPDGDERPDAPALRHAAARRARTRALARTEVVGLVNSNRTPAGIWMTASSATSES